jgi:hypothetical protein
MQYGRILPMAMAGELQIHPVLSPQRMEHRGCRCRTYRRLSGAVPVYAAPDHDVADSWRQAKCSPPRAVIGQFTSAAAVWHMLIASAVAAVS